VRRLCKPDWTELNGSQQSDTLSEFDPDKIRREWTGWDALRRTL